MSADRATRAVGPCCRRPPRFKYRLRSDETDEPVLVQALIAKCAVKALDVRVLDRLARANETERNPTSVGPRIKGQTGEFGTVVHHTRPGQPDGHAQMLEDANDARTRQRPIDFDGDALARVVVSVVQRPKRRPSASVSVRQSIDQRSRRLVGRESGSRSTRATRFRRRRTCTPASR